MSTHLVTWNPDKWDWEDYDDLVELTSDGEVVDEQWSVSRRRNGIDTGDRVYMLRQGARGRGVLGVGVIYSEPFVGNHWADNGDETMYCEIVWTELLPVEDAIPIETLEVAVPTVPWRKIFSSGYTVDPDGSVALDAVWATHSPSGAAPSPAVVLDAFPVEGAARRSMMTWYERSPKARRQCIAAHGAVCVVCAFDFEATYGERGAGFIHVHHIDPLHRKGYSHEVDPVADLRPVCPNCHAMLHRGPLMTPVQLAQLLGK